MEGFEFREGLMPLGHTLIRHGDEGEQGKYGGSEAPEAQFSSNPSLFPRFHFRSFAQLNLPRHQHTITVKAETA
jgi:hypothetical protein